MKFNQYHALSMPALGWYISDNTSGYGGTLKFELCN